MGVMSSSTSALDRDAALLRRFAAALDRELSTADAVRAALTSDNWRPRDRDHGVVALGACEYGGTTTVSLQAIVHRDRVAVLTARVSWSGAPGPAQLEIFHETIGGRLAPDRDTHSASRTTRDEVVIAALHAERIAALGPPPAVDVPPALAASFATLTALDGDVMVGDVFGYAATRTPGSLAIAALVAARRADVVAVGLRGPCPDGRVFAAQALLSGWATTRRAWPRLLRASSGRPPPEHVEDPTHHRDLGRVAVAGAVGGHELRPGALDEALELRREDDVAGEAVALRGDQEAGSLLRHAVERGE